MRNKTIIAALSAAALIAIGCSSGGGDTAGPGAQGNPADAADKSEAKKIVIDVTGKSTADVTYGLNADQSQEQDAKLPWKKSMSSSEAMTIVTVSAQNKGSGTIGCKITVDGKLAKENTSKGRYAIVTCSTDALT
jgi:hypothetical protein